MTGNVDDSTTSLTHNNVLQQSATQLSEEYGKEALKDVVFGSIAGIIGKIIEYPFDTVKVRLQSQPDHLPLRYSGPLDCFRISFHEEGVRGLYRGISAPLFGAAVETSSLFFSYRAAQELLKATAFIPNDGAKLPLAALTACGAASGAFTSLLLTPIELIKCQMQVPGSSTSLKTQKPISIITSIFHHHGILGFWHGQLGTLIREAGGSAAWFGVYEGISSLFRARSRSNQQDSSGNHPRNLPVWQQMLAGAAAGVSYVLGFFPADTIKSRMQTEAVAGRVGNGKRNTFWMSGVSLWHQQGVKGLYRGCGITVARAAPSSAFIFAVYEGLSGAFR